MTANARPATYFSAPSPGCDLLDAGASTTAISPAIRNHDDVTSTSLPPIGRSGRCRAADGRRDRRGNRARIGRGRARDEAIRPLRARCCRAGAVSAGRVGGLT